MKILTAAILISASIVVNSNEIDDTTITKEQIDSQFVSSASELSDARARLTYMFLDNASEDINLISKIDKQDMSVFNDNKNKAEQKILNYRSEMCDKILNSTNKSLDENINYIFNELEFFDSFTAIQKKSALVGLNVDLLNVVNGFQTKTITTLTPEYIVNEIGQVWVTEKKQECYSFMIDNLKDGETLELNL